MIEMPEALCLAKQLSNGLAGKTVLRVLPPTKAHKFCFYSGDPVYYDAKLAGAGVLQASGFGMFVELAFSNGQKLCVNDGVNIRLVQSSELPKQYQLAILFEGDVVLVFTVAMYGGIYLHDGSFDNEYYIGSKTAISPFSPEFDKHFYAILAQCKQSLSAKAFLATEQRFPGVGNGVIQDILFEARIHPKRKISSLTDDEKRTLLISLQQVLAAMTGQGGRDTHRRMGRLQESRENTCRWNGRIRRIGCCHGSYRQLYCVFATHGGIRNRTDHGSDCFNDAFAVKCRTANARPCVWTVRRYVFRFSSLGHGGVRTAFRCGLHASVDDRLRRTATFYGGMYRTKPMFFLNGAMKKSKG